LNVIDAATIVPFYIEEIFKATGDAGNLAHLRILRFSRVFRILKIGKYNNGLRLIGRVLTNSTNALILLLFFVSIGSLLCGSLMFYCEKGIWDFKQGQFTQ